MMSNKVKDYELRYKEMRLMDQPGDTLVDKMLHVYRSQGSLPPDLRDLSDEELIKRLGINGDEQKDDEEDS